MLENYDGCFRTDYVRDFVSIFFTTYPILVLMVVNRYQAGEGIYDLFDKVLVLNEGRMVYYGSPKEARAYFEGLGYNSLPRQSTADYLTGCSKHTSVL